MNCINCPFHNIDNSRAEKFGFISKKGGQKATGTYSTYKRHVWDQKAENLEGQQKAAMYSAFWMIDVLTFLAERYIIHLVLFSFRCLPFARSDIGFFCGRLGEFVFGWLTCCGTSCDPRTLAPTFFPLSSGCLSVFPGPIKHIARRI